MNWYCDVAPGHLVHQPYHDDEYGFPVGDDVVLFERLSLEIFQAGLSWLIVLKRRESLKVAFAGFDPVRLAAYGPADIDRLLGDSTIIRNRRKVEAIIANAACVVGLQQEHGSLAAWLGEQRLEGARTRTKDSWVKLFRATFRFMGVEVVNEFLMSIGYLPGAHREDCPVFARIAEQKPPWMMDRDLR
ncbi:MAG: DNA-3-methyladenine glycosylase I [Alphaproteobacteria bacterium]|nr:DNA-3-methyladenine glycosylase I [Alphaproteobacteria bacterium]